MKTIILKELMNTVKDCAAIEELKVIEVDPTKRYLFVTKAMRDQFIEQLSIALAHVLDMPQPPLLIANNDLYEHLKVFELERYSEVQ